MDCWTGWKDGEAIVIFKNEHCNKVLNGEKTQTRRLFREGDYTWLAPGSAGARITEVCDRNHRVKWQVGRSYAVQPGRGKKAIGRFKLLAIRRELLQNISDDDARQEGIGSYVMQGSGGGSNPQMVYPAFADKDGGFPCATQAFEALWDSINKRPGTRWVDNPTVWALTFQCVLEPLNDRTT